MRCQAQRTRGYLQATQIGHDRKCCTAPLLQIAVVGPLSLLAATCCSVAKITCRNRPMRGQGISSCGNLQTKLSRCRGGAAYLCLGCRSPRSHRRWRRVHERANSAAGQSGLLPCSQDHCTTPVPRAQGLARYLQSEGVAHRGVVVGFDHRAHEGLSSRCVCSQLQLSGGCCELLLPYLVPHSLLGRLVKAQPLQQRVAHLPLHLLPLLPVLFIS